MVLRFRIRVLGFRAVGLWSVFMIRVLGFRVRVIRLRIMVRAVTHLKSQ